MTQNRLVSATPCAAAVCTVWTGVLVNLQRRINLACRQPARLEMAAPVKQRRKATIGDFFAAKQPPVNEGTTKFSRTIV